MSGALRFERTTEVPATAEELFDWHARPGAFERLDPPWAPVRVLSREGSGLDVGVRLTIQVPPSPIPLTTVHTRCVRPEGFVDELVSGPFESWRHEHAFADGSLTDRIDFRPVLGLGAAFVERRLGHTFAFRHRRTALDLARHGARRDRPRLRVAITGATGLLGTELSRFLTTGGHEVVPVSRRVGVRWDPEQGTIDAAALEGLDAVVHLAGESIGESRWTEAVKERIRRSRVASTELLAKALPRLSRPPRVVVSGSAVGLYGDRGDEVLTEAAAAGEGFLAEVATAWEAAARPLAEAGIRLVTGRTGLVLSARGGLLAAIAQVTKLGGGGPLGDGQHWQPWIAIDDWVGAVHHALWDDGLAGPVNLVAPDPVRQGALASTLAAVLDRPALLPTPRAAVSLVMGSEKARELVFASQRAEPRALLDRGFSFAHPSLEEALRFELGRL